MSTYSALAEQYLAITNRTGDEYMVRCIFHADSKASMQFNVANGLFICFACGERGNAKKIQRQLGLREQEGEFDMADIRARLDLLRNPRSGLPVLDETTLDRYRFPCDYWSAKRGLSTEAIDAFDLGYDPLGGFVTIPIRNTHGGLLGVIRRYLDPDAELRYRYPKGFQRSSNLFGSWMVEHDEEADSVVLVEGSIDAIKVWQEGYAAVGCYGNTINPAQIRVLRRLGVSQITLFGDNDKGGRQLWEWAQGWHVRRCQRTGRVLAREYHPETDLTRDFIVRSVNWSGVRAKDPGDLTGRQIVQMLRNPRMVGTLAR